MLLGLVIPIDSSGSSDLSSIGSYDGNGTKLAGCACPHCRSSVEFPESMGTPMIYCSECHRSFHRASPREDEYQSWGLCRGCLLYGEIQDFSRDIKFYSNGKHYKTERWTTTSCCQQCAQKALYPWRMKMRRSRARFPELNIWDEAYQISQANRILKKRMKKRHIRRSDWNEIRKAETTYESYLLTTQANSPDLNYCLYLARSMRKDVDGAEAAIQDVLRECGNYQPAIGALEWLMEQKLNDLCMDRPRLEHLEGRYQMLLGNCLGRIAPPRERQTIDRKKEVVRGRNRPSFLSLLRR